MESILEGLSKAKRQELIVKEINIHTRVTYEYLAQALDVSEDTIRRDVNELVQGKQSVVKIKGGVMTSAYQHNHAPDVKLYSLQQKQIIAKKLLTLIKKDMVLLLGGGTTISEFIKMIPNNLKMTVFTVNLFSAVELLNKPNIKTIFLGGEISTFSQMSIGVNVVMSLQEIKADLCIIGANAIDLEHGFTDTDWDTVQVKKAMVEACHKLAILAISEKLNSTMKFKISDWRKINFLVTEKEPDNSIFAEVKANYPQVVII